MRGLVSLLTPINSIVYLNFINIFLFIHIALATNDFNSVPPPTPQHHPTQYIVSFTSYRLHSFHELTVRSALALSPATSWHLLSRRNHAAPLPTDFLIVETDNRDILSTLASCAAIRRVSPQTYHPRSLSAIRLPTEFEERDPRAHSTSKSSSSESPTHHPTLHPFGAGHLWRRGYTGRGVSVAVFDTGLSFHTQHFPNVVSRTDWTGENTTHDHVGHGTFVTGLIAGRHPACPGIAPDVNLHVFRVFTAAQVSYTSWFLDAFNYALHIGIDVLNLSIGGPDFADNPFTEKIDELAAHGIIAVSAIGNDGPLWGSLNNPGDMMPVVGVGGVEPNGRIASFSSRGMTTHELDQSYGRVKPDIVAYARSLVAPSHRSSDKCKRLSGTSVASPVVAGAIALLASIVPPSRRHRVINPASVKRALIQSAHWLPYSSIYEQGAGLLDVNDAATEIEKIDREFLALDPPTKLTLNFASRALSTWRSSNVQNDSDSKFALERDLEMEDANPENGDDDIDQNNENYSKKNQPRDGRSRRLHSSVRSKTRRRLSSSSRWYGLPPTQPGPSAAFFPAYYDLRTAGCSHMWPHCAQPLFEGGMPVHMNATILNPGGVEGHVASVVWVPARNGNLLRVVVTRPEKFWPWSAGMGIHISVREGPLEPVDAEGVLQVRVVSVHERTHSDIELPIKASIALPPPREKRLLWDMYHSVRYPPGYVPRDSLSETKDMLDWLGDHPHTNFHSLFRELLLAGFTVDILDQPLSCFGLKRAREYGGIMLLDSEDFFSRNDTDLLEKLVKLHGLALIVAAEWYNLDAMESIRFEDDNTRSWWSPIIAGGNIPGLNTLLDRFGIAFGEEVLSGDVHPGTSSFRFESGVPIVKFPPGGELVYANGLSKYEGDPNLVESQALSRSQSPLPPKSLFSTKRFHDVPVFGLTKSGRGAVLAYGDTNCLDTAYPGSKCHAFFVEAVRHLIFKCAATTACHRMLQRSVIADDGVWPATSDHAIDRSARPLPQDLLNVFRPHSKYPVRCTPNDSDDLCDVDAVWDDSSACEKRFSLQKEPLVDALSGKDMEVDLPPLRRAEPAGSESFYFEEYVSTWHANWHNRVALNTAGHGEVSQLFRLYLRGAHLRSLVLIIVGFCLMVASISLRRLGGSHHGSLLRKLHKPRTSEATKIHTALSATGNKIVGRIGRTSSQSIGTILRSGRTSSSIYY